MSDNQSHPAVQNDPAVEGRGDYIDAIALGLKALGVLSLNNHQARAQAGLVELALNQLGFIIVPLKSVEGV